MLNDVEWLEEVKRQLISEKLVLSKIESEHYRARIDRVSALESKVMGEISVNNAEERLLKAIVMQAIDDLAKIGYSKDAYDFLTKNCWPLEYYGADSDWVKRLITSLDLEPVNTDKYDHWADTVYLTWREVANTKWKIKRRSS